MNASAYDLVVLGGGIVGLWVARHAARAGAKVVVVEIGPDELAQRKFAHPPIRFANRENRGTIEARNHVLTGNSSFWGGGLARNPRVVLQDLFGPALAAEVEAEYPHVEAELGVRNGFARESPIFGGRELHEVAVLPGRRRGLWAGFDEPGVTCLTRSQVVGVHFDHQNRIDRLEIQSSDGARCRLVCRDVVLSMGVIDSNLFVQNWLASVVPPPLVAELGTRLHDHWSVPIAELTWKGGTDVNSLFPPKFRGGVVAGRRLGFDRGFFHVTADLDRMPPYDRIKELMRLRQQGTGPLALMAAALRTLSSPVGMVRAAAHYAIHRELHIQDGSTVRLVIDFESSRVPANRLVAGQSEAVLHWDLRDDDRACFSGVLRDQQGWWDDVCRRAGVPARWLVDPSLGSDRVHRYLDSNATDAYHLGGGLHPDYASVSGPSEPTGRLRGCPNLFIAGTAFFARPGVANPVLTLLARANVFVRELSRGNRQE